MTVIQQNLQTIKVKIRKACERCGRNPDEVRLVAVSKKMPIDSIKQAYDAGHRFFGENYLQEAIPKITALPVDIRWHFIGHLQSKKAKDAVQHFDMIETVDRFKVARLIAKQLTELDKTMSILIQVNASGEEQKSGVAYDEAVDLVSSLQDLENIHVAGLMTMPPFNTDPEMSRPYFRKLADLAEKMKKKGLLGSRNQVELSMGMSGDFEVAVEEGATLIRVGTAIFGERQY